MPVGAPAQLIARLLAEGAPVALGLDLPLGLPRAYAKGCAAADFPAFLRGLRPDAPFFQVNTLASTISIDQPFYPQIARKGVNRRQLLEGLRLANWNCLLRACDRQENAAPLFWTLGAKQVGKAAITGWRDCLMPALENGVKVRLWPFDGDLQDLLAPGQAVLAEVYPAAALRNTRLALGGSKRSQAARQGIGSGLLDHLSASKVQPSDTLRKCINNGFGADAAGEDRFDSLLGMLDVIRAVDGTWRPGPALNCPAVRQWEGWMLGV